MSVAGVGGNLASGLFEDFCTTLVGASGAVFGFMGFFIADLIVNFESIAWPFLRAATIVVFLIFFIVNAVVQNAGNVSHASHVGGLVCGLFPSMLFLPNLKDRRLAAVRRQLRGQQQDQACSDAVLVNGCVATVASLSHKAKPPAHSAAFASPPSLHSLAQSCPLHGNDQRKRHGLQARAKAVRWGVKSWPEAELLEQVSREPVARARRYRGSRGVRALPHPDLQSEDEGAVLVLVNLS